MPRLNINHVNYDLRVLTGEEVTIIGECYVNAQHSKIVKLPLVVLKTSRSKLVKCLKPTVKEKK